MFVVQFGVIVSVKGYLSLWRNGTLSRSYSDLTSITAGNDASFP